MSKATRLKAARRKQHNKTAKERDRQWKAECESRREKWLADQERRELEGGNVKVEPPRSKTTLEQILDNAIAGSSLASEHGINLAQTLGATMPAIWKGGALDVYALTQRMLPIIDTEGYFPGSPRPESIKVADPNQYHTEQCKANHRERVIEASQIESDLLTQGEEGLAVYLRPTIALCTCDNKPEDEDGSNPA